jgi:splicing factor 3B subunit 5
MGSDGQKQLTSQLEHLNARYVGTGHADMDRHEWAEHQHRDSIASYLGHSSMVEYFALAEGISVGRARLNLLERLHRPVGEPPKSQDTPGEPLATVRKNDTAAVTGRHSGSGVGSGGIARR